MNFPIKLEGRELKANGVPTAVLNAELVGWAPKDWLEDGLPLEFSEEIPRALIHGYRFELKVEFVGREFSDGSVWTGWVRYKTTIPGSSVKDCERFIQAAGFDPLANYLDRQTRQLDQFPVLENGQSHFLSIGQPGDQSALI